MGHLARRNGVDKGSLQLMGGALRTSDARRFLVEAMVCAMNADGVVKASELAVLRQHLAGHPLFLGVPATVADMMITMATDALACAGGPHGRVKAIAAGLPSRIHRLTAYAMACEVARSDDDVASTEVAFLEHLRQHLRLSTAEGLDIMRALEGRLGDYLEARIAWIRGLVPAAAELFAIRAHTRKTLDDAHLAHVRDFFQALPDLTGDADEIDGQLRAAFRKPQPDAIEVHDELRALAATVTDAVDRWWLVVYVLADEPGGGGGWRRGLFGCLVQNAFGLGEHDMDLAAAEAQLVARAPSRLSSPA